jgi:hypothetical protein
MPSTVSPQTAMSSQAGSNSPIASPTSHVASDDHSPSLDKGQSEGAQQEEAGQADGPADPPRSGSPEPTSASTSATTPMSGNWQAIWSSAHNAYYFYNAVTHETTWVNPLQPADASPSASPTGETTTVTPSISSEPAPSAADSNPQQEDPSSASSSSGATPVPASVAQIYALQEAAAAQGIDPSLAYLDPSLAGPSSAPGGAYNFAARFNAHTGTFTRPDGRDPTHLSEYERMKRMSSVYFNMEQWEQEVAQRKNQEDEDAANGKKRKRPTKKDLVCYFFLPGLCQLSSRNTHHMSSNRSASKSRRGSKRLQRRLGCARRPRRVSNFYSRGSS